MTISPLLRLPLMEADLARVEQAMRRSVETSDAYLTEIASHLIGAGGKRLRPLLAMTSFQAVDDRPITDDAVQGGISCELVHLGSLYHDDVMDEATTRRGVDTVNARWGNLQAILAGDFLLARASEIAASLGVEVARLLAQTIARLCEGQIEELKFTYNVERTIPSYLASIDGKTASLYGTACRVGGIVAGHDRSVIDALTAYGNAYGMVFQIVDDLLDLTSTEVQLGKPAGHDMEEGVYTLPVLLTLINGGPMADELRQILGKPINNDERTRALDIVRSNGGVAAAIEHAHRFVDDARRALSALPRTAAVAAMEDAPAALLSSIQH